MKLLKKEHQNKTYRVITKEQPSSIVSENYRRVKVSLDVYASDKPLKVVQVTSTSQGEGKTITLLNIAQTYAEDGKKVICVDLDLRRPKLHRTINVKNENGIIDVITGKITLDEAIKHGESFDVLNRGSETDIPTACVSSKKLGEIIEELKNQYDVIFIDNPPVLAVSDSLIVSKYCDGALFIVSQLYSEKNASKEAVRILRQNDVNILGCIYTNVDLKKESSYYSSSRYYYSSYYGKKNNK